MLQKQLKKHDLLSVAERIMFDLNPKNESDRLLLNDGLQLYRQGYVYNVSAMNNIINGTVEEEDHVYQVSIDIIDETKSRCTCYDEKNCLHILAVLFYCSASLGGVGDVLGIWKQKEKPVAILKTMKTASSLLKKTSYEDTDAQTWDVYFEKQYEQYKSDLDKSIFRKTVAESIFQSYFKRVDFDTPKDMNLKNTFRLYAALFSIKKLLLPSGTDRTSYSFWKDPVQEALSLLLDEAYHALENIKYAPLLADHEPIVRHLLTLSRPLPTLAYKYFNPLYDLYRTLWYTLFNNDNLIQEHISLLESRDSNDYGNYELAHLYVLLTEDEKAQTIISKLDPIPLFSIEYWVHLIDELGGDNKDRIQQWMVYTYDIVRQELTYTSRYEGEKLATYFLQLYDPYMDEEREVIFQELLPYSYDYYCEYLLDTAAYERWVELHMLVNIDPFSDFKNEIKIIEKNDRKLLLPLYHYWATYYIGQKNRQSYKFAVRYLKKLRIIYKKEKNTAQWDQYINTLASTYSRLRALQEELRKGKLLDD